MYRPSDTLMNGRTISTVFNTRDNLWHDKYMKPIRGLWTMTKVLDVEPLIDETLKQFTDKIEKRFISGANADKPCMMDDWLGYCK